jgi:hypothetical protein
VADLAGEVMNYVIKAVCPEGFKEEKNYVLDLIKEFSGIEFEVSFKAADHYEFQLPSGCSIFFKDAFFGIVNNGDFIKPEFIPAKISALNCPFCNGIPVIYGDNSFEATGRRISFGLDIIASIFFMLSRWEEIAVKERDLHGRFEALSSLAVKENFIERPVVDEYISLFKMALKNMDESVIFVQHDPKVTITCDVDRYEKFYEGNALRTLAGDLLVRHDPVLFFTDIFKYLNKSVLKGKDPFDKFDRIFDIARRFKTVPSFFILTTPKGPYSDGWFASALKDKEKFFDFQKRGANIGLHYGYFSLMNEQNIIEEKNALEKKYSLSVISGRAHFLQFDASSSFGVLEKAGIKEDHSLGYSGCSGFRCGTGRAFRPWNFYEKRTYRILETPLIVMDTTLYSHKKMNKQQIREKFLQFINTGREHGTDITILIHNSSPDFVFEAIEEINLQE